LATTQVRPHTLQFFGSELSGSSQPLLGLPSQSPRPAGQSLTPQTPALQRGVALPASHTLRHLPQLVASLAVFASQPFDRSSSQSVKPGSQLISQAPATQLGAPFTAGQESPQPLQLATSVRVLVSQPFLGFPSQSANGAVHRLMLQVPPVQRASACIN